MRKDQSSDLFCFSLFDFGAGCRYIPQFGVDRPAQTLFKCRKMLIMICHSAKQPISMDELATLRSRRPLDIPPIFESGGGGGQQPPSSGVVVTSVGSPQRS
jgi:hypothetical protein